MDNDEEIVGHKEIYLRFFRGRYTWLTYRKKAKDMIEAGAIGRSLRGRPPHRKEIVWTTPALMRTYQLLENQKKVENRKNVI